MEGSRKFFIVIAVSLVLGLLIGSGIRGGKKDQKLELNEMLELASAEYSNLVRENEELNSLLKKAGAGEKENKTLAGEITSLKEELRRTGDEKKKLEQAVASFEAKTSEQQAQEEALRASSEEIQKSIASLKLENEALKGQNRKLHDDYAAAQEIIAGLQVRLSEPPVIAGQTAAEEDKDRISALEGENQALKARMEKVSAENASAAANIDRLKAELAEVEKKAQAGEELLNLSTDLKNRVAELENENRDLKELVEKISRMLDVKEKSGGI